MSTDQLNSDSDVF